MTMLEAWLLSRTLIVTTTRSRVSLSYSSLYNDWNLDVPFWGGKSWSSDALCMCRRSGLHISNYYGIGTGPIWFGRVDCTGNETSLAECRHIDWSHSCNHEKDISITCAYGKIILRCTCIVSRYACQKILAWNLFFAILVLPQNFSSAYWLALFTSPLSSTSLKCIDG